MYFYVMPENIQKPAVSSKMILFYDFIYCPTASVMEGLQSSLTQ